MTRTIFLSRLRKGLAGLRPSEIEEVAADYDTHFAEGLAAGRSEEEIAEALGNPERLAHELRAEAGLRRWEEERTAGTFVGAVFALVGLIAVDLIFLLPLLFIGAVVLFVLAVVLLALLVAGVAIVATIFSWDTLSTGTAAIGRAFAGVGLVAGAIGGGALLLLGLDGLIRLLGHYARLHYRLVSSPPKTEQ
jgi:uncharacterized membrane protein